MYVRSYVSYFDVKSIETIPLRLLGGRSKRTVINPANPIGKARILRIAPDILFFFLLFQYERTIYVQQQTKSYYLPHLLLPHHLPPQQTDNTEESRTGHGRKKTTTSGWMDDGLSLSLSLSLSLC